MSRLTAQLEANPQLRLVVIGAMTLIMGFMMYTRVLSHSAAPTDSKPAVPGAEAPAAGAPAGTAGEAGTVGATGTKPGADRARSGAAAKPEALAKPESLLTPGTGLPAKVAKAYDRGKVVVLLITQRNGIEDRLNREGAHLLAMRRKQAAVFYVDVERVSDYSRLTRGVDVSRVPALVVVPAGQTKVPLQATVLHGFLDPKSMVQAVDDALYKGPAIPPYPE